MRKIITSIVCLFALSATAWGKDKVLISIVLYPQTSGPAYAQLSNVFINGKRELLACTGDAFDANSYRKLPKVVLEPGMKVEHESGGMLVAGTAGSTCVVPGNLKLEKGRSYTPRELADLATLTGHLISKSSNTDAPPSTIVSGMQIYFVEEESTEVAEYLRAKHFPSISLWRDFLKQFPSNPNAAEARSTLAALIAKDAGRNLDDYRKAPPGERSKYESLKTARSNALEAQTISPSSSAAEEVLKASNVELEAMLLSGRQEFAAYGKALAESAAGYEHLARAQAQADHVTSVDPAYAGIQSLQADIEQQQQELGNSIQRAELLVSNQKFDDAFAAVAGYRGFAAEVPRLRAVIEQSFQYHRRLGQQFATESKWEEAIAEYRRALACRTDKETSELVQRATAEQGSAHDRDAAQKAMDDAAVLAASKQFVEAYRLLEALPENQRKLAAAQMESLQQNYVQDLVTRANMLVRVHLPVRGRADEDAVRQAHDYLERAAALSGEEPIKVKLDLVADRIGDYYLKQAQRTLAKPRGSGLALGWMLLTEAEQYRPGHEQVRNLKMKFAPEHNIRAKLSVAIRFRDQTSRRDSVGFAEQLSDAVAAGLENSGLTGIQVVPWRERTGESESETAMSGLPNFQVVGNIVQHRVDKQVDRQRQSSRYRAGYLQVKNPAWLEAKRVLDSAQSEYDRTQAAHKAALPKMKKKESAESTAALEALAKNVEAAKSKLDAIPETQLQQVVEPYNYIRQNSNLTAIVEVTLRLSDPLSGLTGPLDTVRTELPRTAVQLENVKPDDVDGVVEQGVPVNENQLLAQAEAKAQGSLVAKLIERLGEIPGKLLDQARSSATSGDKEGAAEKYILYLNCTSPGATPQRVEASNFLRNEFNVGGTIEQ
ncbi:MAG: hypothetical protein ACR2IF_09300 [Terriglobales bacterium]